MPFTKNLLPHRDTTYYDNLILDYIEDNPFLNKFYAFEDSPEGIKKRIESYQNPRLDRVLLRKTLLSQYEKGGIINPSKRVIHNINALENETTFTISTGHQLNIFGGPLYVMYKLISAIRITQELNSKYPSYHFVPVYWMATEDHDITEISYLNIFGKQFQWENSWKGMSGDMPLNGIEIVIDGLKSAFGDSRQAKDLLDLLENAYLSSATLGEASRKWVNSLLGDYGLVIIDGNESSLKQSFKDIILDEVLNQTTFGIVSNTIHNLSVKYNAQANPREINMFYTGKNFRERIVSENGKIKVLNTDISFTTDSIQKEVESNPGSFSPNVLLRPLYQESILPNVAYIGGPAEVAYWLELKDVFEKYNVPFPSVLLRSCAVFIGKNYTEKLRKLSIEDTEIFLSADEIIKRFIQKNAEDKIELESIVSVFSNEFAKLVKRVSKIDPTLVSVVEAENQKLKTILLTLEEKILRIQKKKRETEINQIRKVKESLFPKGGLQEREDSILPYLLNMGNSFIEMLLVNLDPFEKKFCILKEFDPSFAEVIQ